MSVDAVETKAWEPNIVAFCCNWCSYSGADLAGTNRLEYPTNLKIIRVPCSGRIDPFFVMKAFQKGADGVMIAGCHPGDCHYTTGNYYTRRRFLLIKRLLEYLGIEEGRFAVSWISASESVKFQEMATQILKQVTELGPNRMVKKSS